MEEIKKDSNTEGFNMKGVMTVLVAGWMESYRKAGRMKEVIKRGQKQND
jgi:hypothetical protein